MSNKMVPRESNHTNLLDSYKMQEWESIRRSPNDVKKRLELMIVNGQKLQSHEISALATYSVVNDLNPFDGEAYYIPHVGCVPGIQGYRRKATETLIKEAQLQGKSWGYFDLDYFKITDPDDANFNPDTDLAYKAILTDSVTKAEHLKMLSDFAKDLKDAFKEESLKSIMDEAEKRIGRAPKWEGIGVVYGSEHFSAPIKNKSGQVTGYRDEKWDRHERAMKRAAKNAIRKRFSSLNLKALSVEGIEINPDDIEVLEPDIEGEYKQLEETNQIDEESQQKETKQESVAEAMKALGYDDYTELSE